MRYNVVLNEQEEEIEVTHQGNRLRISFGGRTFEATVVYRDGPHFVLEVEEEGPDGFVCRRRIRAAGYRQGDRRQLWANGRLVNYSRLMRGPAATGDEAIEAGALSAPIPAVVTEILVGPGDRVETAQKLILLESMKMILPIQAPYAGQVAAVHCAVGQAVQPGVQLLELNRETAV
jgi:biotin carboxyl carrier protein